MKILIYQRQNVDYVEQDDTTCLVPQFKCYVEGPTEICSQRIFQWNHQELHPQARFFKGLDMELLSALLAHCECNPLVTSGFTSQKKTSNAEL